MVIDINSGDLTQFGGPRLPGQRSQYSPFTDIQMLSSKPEEGIMGQSYELIEDHVKKTGDYFGRPMKWNEGKGEYEPYIMDDSAPVEDEQWMLDYYGEDWRNVKNEKSIGGNIQKKRVERIEAWNEFSETPQGKEAIADGAYMVNYFSEHMPGGTNPHPGRYNAPIAFDMTLGRTDEPYPDLGTPGTNKKGHPTVLRNYEEYMEWRYQDHTQADVMMQNIVDETVITGDKDDKSGVARRKPGGRGYTTEDMLIKYFQTTEEGFTELTDEGYEKSKINEVLENKPRAGVVNWHGRDIGVYPGGVQYTTSDPYEIQARTDEWMDRVGSVAEYGVGNYAEGGVSYETDPSIINPNYYEGESLAPEQIKEDTRRDNLLKKETTEDKLYREPLDSEILKEESLPSIQGIFDHLKSLG